MGTSLEHCEREGQAMAAEYLTSLMDNPEAAESAQRLQELLNRKLWHQLTVAVEEEMKKPWLQAGDTLVTFYELFIKEFEQKINPVKMTTFAVAASRKHTDHEKAVVFLKEAMGRQKTSKQEKETCAVEAEAIFNCEIAVHYLAMEPSQVEQAKEIMKEEEGN